MSPTPDPERVAPHDEPTRGTTDRGSVTVEVVIVAPIAIALLCLVALVGRTATAREQVAAAARDAARAASLERDPTAAERTAELFASRELTADNVNCVSTDVSTDLASFGPGGQVRVTVTCQIPMSDLGLISLSGTRAVTASSVSVVDLYRGPAS